VCRETSIQCWDIVRLTREVEVYRPVGENEWVIVKVRRNEVMKNGIEICVRKFFEVFRPATKEIGRYRC